MSFTYIVSGLLGKLRETPAYGVLAMDRDEEYVLNNVIHVEYEVLNGSWGSNKAHNKCMKGFDVGGCGVLFLS